MEAKLIKIIVLTKISPKARPRVGKYGNWYSPSSKDEENLGMLILREMRLHNIKKQEGRLSVKLIIGYKNKKRGDMDNIEKYILDSCNGVLWDDDRNIYEKYTKITEHCIDYLLIEVEKMKISDVMVDKIVKWVQGG